VQQSNSKVFWKQGGYEYMVGLKMGEMTNVVALANSAIRNRLWPQQAKRVCRLTPICIKTAHLWVEEQVF